MAIIAAGRRQKHGKHDLVKINHEICNDKIMLSKKMLSKRKGNIVKFQLAYLDICLNIRWDQYDGPKS